MSAKNSLDEGRLQPDDGEQFPEPEPRSVRNFLDLSTAYIPYEEWEAMPACEGVLLDPNEWGRWVWVPDEVDERVHEYPTLTAEQPHLVALWKLARKLGCDWIKFDQDADTEFDYPTFTW